MYSAGETDQISEEKKFFSFFFQFLVIETMDLGPDLDPDPH